MNRKLPEINVARRFNYTITNSSAIAVKTIAVIVVIVPIVVKYNRIAVKSLINASVSRMFKIVSFVIFIFLRILRTIFAIVPTLLFVIAIAVVSPVIIRGPVIIAI
jgi:hypothetical protein